MVQFWFKGLNCHVNQQKTDMNISMLTLKHHSKHQMSKKTNSYRLCNFLELVRH